MCVWCVSVCVSVCLCECVCVFLCLCLYVSVFGGCLCVWQNECASLYFKYDELKVKKILALKFRSLQRMKQVKKPWIENNWNMLLSKDHIKGFCKTMLFIWRQLYHSAKVLGLSLYPVCRKYLYATCKLYFY